MYKVRLNPQQDAAVGELKVILDCVSILGVSKVFNFYEVVEEGSVMSKLLKRAAGVGSANRVLADAYAGRAVRAVVLLDVAGKGAVSLSTVIQAQPALAV